ncbi:DUF1811 family protein [Brevibacillus laterosporus]|uniref:DUF1811 family protein n=1 Tax=Brevibacillus laterosporus TaxID=1465 RepID=UPI00264E824F|nr:DUF1811 family protein [Brevibacillus laterosporus]MDN9009744.1 DUF1811 family protein [Brevibacillus laterosporus]MDO0940257.1 DUF1811 family protein [Brevibacillus laterosporus]
MRLYSQFTLAELQEEMETLRKEIDEKKRQNDQVSVGILEQKFFMAKSYYLGTKEFRIGKCYKVHGQQEPFIIDYFNGVFAWGTFQHDREAEAVGFPVGMLEE